MAPDILLEEARARPLWEMQYLLKPNTRPPQNLELLTEMYTYIPPKRCEDHLEQ